MTSFHWLSKKGKKLAIKVNLNLILAKNNLKANEIAGRIGITEQNLSVLRTGRAKAIRFSTLDKLCEVLQCQPGDILEFVEEESDDRE